MINTCLQSQIFTLKGRLYTLTVISLLDVDYSIFRKQISELVKKAPNLFTQTPVVIDCGEVTGKHFELMAFTECLREHGLVPIGIQKGDTRIEGMAKSQGLAILNASGANDKSLININSASSFRKNNKTKLITSPVRSGQQIVSKGDLIITSHVSHGSELLADGNIHVYGPLRGRALAGISGNTQARIFCQTLEAELVSIAGFYRLSDAIGTIKEFCQIYLQDEQIKIKPI